MSNILEIRNLKVNFYLPHQTITAVEEVNLDIKKDEIVVLAGESGSGKTITALSITRLIPPNARIISGSIKFNNENLLGLEESRLIGIRGRGIAYIFQEPVSFLNPLYTVAEQIAEAVMLHKNKTKKESILEAKALLEMVKIKDAEKVLFDYPHQLSGGMNQRVFIAMALAFQPRLLIADEPTTSLDVTTEAEILNLLLQLKNELGFSLLFITHNLSIARKIADRVCIMHNGKIVEEGAWEDIYHSPKHFHTKELIEAYEKIGKI